MAEKERVEPPTVQPIEFESKCFSPLDGMGHFQVVGEDGQHQITIHQWSWNDEMESDKQEDYVATMSLDRISRKIILEYESGKRFALSVDTLAVERL